MPAIIKTKFRVRSAKEFLNSFPASTATSGENYYLFVARPTPWNAPDNIIWPWSQSPEPSASTNADLYPPIPLDAQFDEYRAWDEMLGLKRINKGDVSLVIPRSDWDSTGKTVYAVFTDFDSHLYNHPSPTDVGNLTSADHKPGNFYVLNSQNDLFVCLYNNNYGPSTREPVLAGSPTNLIDYSTHDGYVWKYITSITSSDAVKFLTDSWIPIKTIEYNALGQVIGVGHPNQKLVQEDALNNAGSVLSVVIPNVREVTCTWPLSSTYGVKITSNNSCVIENTDLVAGIPTTNDAFLNYELKLSASNKFLITAYDGATKTLTIQGSFSGAANVGDQLSDVSIQPRLVVLTNSDDAPLFTPVVGVDGKISKIEVDYPGKGATFVALYPIPLPAHTISPEKIFPGLRPVLAPLNGLGRDLEKQLGAFFVMVSTQIKYSEADTDTGLSDFPVKNDYRQLGILKNALKFDGSGFCSANTLRATERANVKFTEAKLGIVGDPGFKSDEVITINRSSVAVGSLLSVDFKFFDRVSPTDDILGQVTFIQNPDTGYKKIQPGDTLIGVVSGAEATVQGVSNEELKKFEGEIFYLENRRPVLRSVDQVEDIKTIIEF